MYTTDKSHHATYVETAADVHDDKFKANAFRMALGGFGRVIAEVLVLEG
jgi:hypothetical protein